jgi:hypothetical protein
MKKEDGRVTPRRRHAESIILSALLESGEALSTRDLDDILSDRWGGEEWSYCLAAYPVLSSLQRRGEVEKIKDIHRGCFWKARGSWSPQDDIELNELLSSQQ